MTMKTTSGEPTFGVEKFKTVQVKAASGTAYVGYHDGETWFEGHHEKGATKVQLAEEPTELVVA